MGMVVYGRMFTAQAISNLNKGQSVFLQSPFFSCVKSCKWQNYTSQYPWTGSRLKRVYNQFRSSAILHAAGRLPILRPFLSTRFQSKELSANKQIAYLNCEAPRLSYSGRQPSLHCLA